MHRLSALALAAVLGATLVACGGDDPPVAAAGFETRTVEAGEVTVTITPTRLDTTGASFAIVFDTHSVDLDLDVPASAELTVDGQPWNDPSWDGDGPGGHHREGTLTFTAAENPANDATLTIDGLPEPVRATWTLEGT